MSEILLRDAVLREDFPEICRRELPYWHQEKCANNDNAAVCLAMLQHINGGLHHLYSIKIEDRMVQCLMHGSVATFDYAQLTQITLMAHAYCVRVDVSAGGPNMTRIQAWRRKPGEGRMHARHPSLEELKSRIDQILEWKMKAGERE